MKSTNKFSPIKYRQIKGKATAVWGVVDKNNEILTEQLPFYFQRDYAKAAAQQMNAHISEKEKKPFKIKKAFLLYLQKKTNPF